MGALCVPHPCILHFPKGPPNCVVLLRCCAAKTRIALYAKNPESLLVPERLAALRFAPVISLECSVIHTPMPSDFLSGYSRLVTLTLTVETIEGDFQALSQLSQLERLQLQAGLSQLPDGLSQLTLLNLSFNLPEHPMRGWQHLAPLTLLRELHARHCRLSQVPAALSRLTLVSVLDFADNEIAEGWQHLAAMERLPQLHLQGCPMCRLSHVPSAFSRLTAL